MSNSLFKKSGVSDLLRDGNTHLLIVGDSIVANTVGNGSTISRVPAGIMREFGLKTAPIIGVTAPPSSGATDNWARTFVGTNNSRGLYIRPGNTVELTVSGASGTLTFGDKITEANSGATGVYVRTVGSVIYVMYEVGDTTLFTGGEALSASAWSATSSTANHVTTDYLGLPNNLLPGPHTIQEATGNIGLSIQISRSYLQNESVYPQGRWSDNDIILRAFYYSHANAFNCKTRAYRSSAVNSANVDQRSGDNIMKYSELLCAASANSAEQRWEALSSDETGQFTKFGMCQFYRPNVYNGITLDAIGIGGDSVAACVDTSRCSDAHYTTFLSNSRITAVTNLVVLLWYGQNDAGMSQEDFESNLNAYIARIIPLALTAGYTNVRFILAATYNTGGAHLVEKSEACHNVAYDNQEYACCFDAYNLFPRGYIIANTSDTIHPNPTLTRAIGYELAREIRNPSDGFQLGRSRSRSR